MADPPPPSYDDAIRENYSAPPLNPALASYNGSEKYRMPEGTRPFPSPSASSNQPSAPSLSEQESIPLASRRDQQETEENDVNSEPELNQQGFVKRHLVTIWKLLIIGALVGLLILFYFMFISPGSPDVPKDCIGGLPYIPRGTWHECYDNYRHGSSCYLLCAKHYSFYDNTYIIGAPGAVYFQCVDSEWIPTHSNNPCSKQNCMCKLDPSSWDDCKTNPPQIVGGTFDYDRLHYDPPYNARHEYFSGTKISFRCDGDLVIEMTQRKCLNARAPDFAIKETGLSRCDDSHNVPPQYKGEYICEEGKWKAYFKRVRQYELNKTLECIAPTSIPAGLLPGSCRNEPPKISKATWIDCQKRTEFRNGEKCNFKCDGNYILSSSKMEEPDKYDREGYYTCTQGKWMNDLFAHGKIECLTITEFIEQKFGKSQG